MNARLAAFFFQVAMADVAVFGLLFVALDVVDGMLARRSKTGPTRVGAALDVESDSVAVLFLSLAASQKVRLSAASFSCSTKHTKMFVLFDEAHDPVLARALEVKRRLKRTCAAYVRVYNQAPSGSPGR